MSTLLHLPQDALPLFPGYGFDQAVNGSLSLIKGQWVRGIDIRVWLQYRAVLH